MLFLILAKLIGFLILLLILGIVQQIIIFPVLLPIFMAFFVLFAKKDNWFWWLAFTAGFWVDLVKGSNLGKTSIFYLFLMLVFWWQWRKNKVLRQ